MEIEFIRYEFWKWLCRNSAWQITMDNWIKFAMRTKELEPTRDDIMKAYHDNDIEGEESNRRYICEDIY